MCRRTALFAGVMPGHVEAPGTAPLTCRRCQAVPAWPILAGKQPVAVTASAPATGGCGTGSGTPDAHLGLPEGSEAWPGSNGSVSLLSMPADDQLPANRALCPDDLLEGRRRQLVAALARRVTGSDEEDAPSVDPVPADPGVCARATAQPVGAVLAYDPQAQLGVEVLGAGAAGVRDLERPVGEHGSVHLAARVVNAASSEQPRGDDARRGRRPRGCRHELEGLESRPARPGGRAGAGSGQPSAGHRPRNRNHAHPRENLASELRHRAYLP